MKTDAKTAMRVFNTASHVGIGYGVGKAVFMRLPAPFVYIAAATFGLYQVTEFQAKKARALRRGTPITDLAFPEIKEFGCGLAIAALEEIGRRRIAKRQAGGNRGGRRADGGDNHRAGVVGAAERAAGKREGVARERPYG